MKIVRYIQSLLRRIDKDDILNDISNVRQEISEYTLPSCERAANLLDEHEFQSDFAKQFANVFGEHVDYRSRKNYVVQIHQLTKNMENFIGRLENLVDEQTGSTIVAKSMTFQKANIVRVCETLTFLSRYTRELFIYTLLNETALIRQQDPEDKVSVPDARVRWLYDNMVLYSQLIGVFTRSGDEITRIIKDIPQIEIDPETYEEVIASTGNRKLDPLGLMRAGAVLNPIYHVRVRWEDWQIARYEKAQEERKMLEYQLKDLENAKNGQDDPKLDQAIEYTQDRINKQTRRINEYYEKVYGDE